MNNMFEPLNDDELKWLDDFLLERIDDDADCEGKDEGVLNVSELDGLMTAVASGPVMVQPSQWMPKIWGDFPPAWYDEQEFQTVMSLFMRHMNSITTLLMEQPGDFEPMFEECIVKGETHTIVDEWCEGYMRGVALALEQWEMDTIEMKVLLAPIKAFQVEESPITDDKFSEQEINKLQKAITPNAREIHAYWLARRATHSPTTTFKHNQPKVGRNDPCPCGSGKKYKQCCLGQKGVAQSIIGEITEAAEEQPFSSLEELNDFAQQQTQQRNQKALDEFCGLSPGQMSHLLYTPFSSPQTLSFTVDGELTQDTRIMRVFIPLVEAIGESGLKVTATGNLPLKFCKAMAEQFRQEDDHTRLFSLGGIRSETDFEALHCTRLVAQLAGLIRKYRGKFVLTRKCREMLATQGTGQLYFELFKAYTTKFNWGYRDRYPEAHIIQQSFLFTLFLLTSFGETEQPPRFYADKFLTAFPMALDMFPETTYSTAENTARHCYFTRALERFAAFFGLAELELKARKMSLEPYLVRKSKLLDCFVVFK
jgi:yecA family protein